MPAVSANETYKVNNIRLGSDQMGMYLTLQSAAAAGFVLCFCSGREADLQDAKELLSEDDIRNLVGGGEIHKRDFRFQGVKRSAFFAQPVFRNFHAYPPEIIEIWAVSYDALYDAYTVYVPDHPAAQSAYVPLRYRVSYQRDNVFCFLNVELMDGGNYNDGDLVYEVRGFPYLPVTAKSLGHPFRVKLSGGEAIRVIPRPGNEKKFILVS